MEIYKTKKNVNGWNPYTYHFISDEAEMIFHQGGNFDLLFTVNPYEFDKLKNEYTFIIKKSEFKEVYDLITNMLKSMKKQNDEWVKLTDSADLSVMPEYKELFERGYFSWKSDAPANEVEMDHGQEKKYNCLSIIPHDDEYELVFIIGNKLSIWGFSVEVNTDRSRYNSLRFDVWTFFKKLEKVCEETSMEELNRILDEKDKELTKKLEN